LLRSPASHPNTPYALDALTPPIGDGTKNRLSEGNSLIVHKSAIKRHRQSLKRRVRNIETKSKLRTLIKRARQAIEAKNQDTASAQIQAVNKALGKAVSKGIIKHNTASRWLSRLSRSAARRSAAG
jgi:small subunit ribosomal protein S20